MNDPQPLVVNTTLTLILAIIVLYVGRQLTLRMKFLQDFNIPEAVSGGLVGGPIARRLIQKNDLSGNPAEQEFVPGPEATEAAGPVTLDGMLDSIFLLAICLAAGEVMNLRLGEQWGLPLPGFLTATFVGIVITNTRDRFEAEIDKPSISLQLFLMTPLFAK